MHNHTAHPSSDLSRLLALLNERLAIIANQNLRAEQPEEQLRQLRQVSEAITHWHEQHRTNLPAKLHHYLTQASFQKARDWLMKVDD